MKKGLPHIFLLILILVSTGVTATDPVFSQFFASPVYLNPAFSGAAHCSRFAMHYQQMQGVDHFRNINVSYDTYIPWLQGGIGAIITSDQADMYQARHMMGLAYAYHLRASRSTSIHFGLQAGYVRNDSRWGRFDFPAGSEDPPGQLWSHGVDFAAGILAYNQRWYAGVAAHHMNRPQMSLFQTHGTRLPVKYTAHMGAWLESGRGTRGQPQYVISPNVIVQMQGYHTHVNAGLYVGREPLMGGIWFRHWLDFPIEGNNSLIFLMGVMIGNYQVAYSYDHSLSGFSGIAQGTHEVSLVLKFNCSRRNIGYHILNCPTF